MAFDPDAYLAAKADESEQNGGGGFDPDAYLAAKGEAPAAPPPAVDMGPAARRAAAGLPPGPRELTSEEAGTSAGPITAGSPLHPQGAPMRGPVSIRQPMEPAAVPSDVPRSRPLGGGGTRVTSGLPLGEMADPLVQAGTATALGMAAGAGAGAAVPRALAPFVAPAVEGGVANAASGGDFDTGAALGLLPIAAPRVARAVAAPARAVASKLAPNAEKAIANAKGWVAKDIAGEIKGASTATARKQLADDAAHVSELVLRDRELDSAINNARAGDVEKVEAARGVVKQRLKTISNDRLTPKWDAASKALPEGGVRAGDLDSFLRTRSEELRATGEPSHVAEADALDGISKNIREAKDWGGGRRFDPMAKVKGGALDGMETGKAIALLEKQKTGPTASALGDEIKRLRADATVDAFDPGTIVPAQQVQKLWSDVAGNAYKSYGGINGTAAFERKLDVASHLREFRDGILAKVAESDPRLASELRSANRDYSALKRVETVMDQRLNHAKANAQGASVPAGFVHTAKKLKHDPIGFAVGLAPDAAIALKRKFDRWAAHRALDAQQTVAVQKVFTAPGPKGPAVRDAVAAGVPASIAMSAARAAAEAGPSQAVAGNEGP